MRRLVGCLLAAAAVTLGAPEQALAIDYCEENFHSQALLIGNKAYRKTFTVPYAHNDVEAIKKFLTEKLCYRDGNIKILKDATYNDMREWLGEANSPEGQLWNDAREKRSNIFVYYSGHGVPMLRDNRTQAFLLPVDTNPNKPWQGYSLDQLDRNLKALNRYIGPNRTVTLVLDSCFSGQSAGGALLAHKGSFTPKMPTGADIIRFTATQPNQLAYWSDDEKLSLFTSAFIDGVSGKADQEIGGNKDGVVNGKEIAAYIADQVSIRARRMGKRQTPMLPGADRIVWQIALAKEAAPPVGSGGVKPSAGLSLAAQEWPHVRATKSIKVLEAFKAKHADPIYRALADERIALLRAEPSTGDCETQLVQVGTQQKCLKPGDVFKDCDDCPSMVVVPAGSFMMGSPADEMGRGDDEGPRRKVTIAEPFAVGRFEITFDEWDACVTAGGCKHRPTDEGWGRGRRPVINVSWLDVKEYVKWLGRKTGRTYRLLSEAEWEYVARAGTDTPYWFGNSIATELANYGAYTYPKPEGQVRTKTVAVDSFKPNPFGLYNVHGNVWEWVEDCFSDSYDGAPNDGKAWRAGDCVSPGLRGGGWTGKPAYLRSAARTWSGIIDRDKVIGFRVARTLAP